MNPSTTRGIAPALTLFFITPLIAEYLLGSLSIAQIGALPILCLLYGSGTVLIREAIRTGRRGWPSAVLLGLAYAILEEGIATQSLFNLHYLHLSLLEYGYLPSLGMGGSWTVYVIALHVIWSVCVPIAIVEALYPKRATTPWLGGIGRSVFGLFLGLGVIAVAGYTHKVEQFRASPAQLALSATSIVIFAVLGLRLRQPSGLPSASAPRALNPWAVGAFSLAAGSLFEVVQVFQQHNISWTITVACRLVVCALAVALALRWSTRPGWSDLHRFALGAGGLLVYFWFGYSVEISLHGASGLPAHSVLVLLALALLLVAGIRLRGRHAPAELATIVGNEA